MTRRGGAVAIALLLLLAGCRTSSDSAIELDGSPRHADAEGVVTKVTAASITLDGTDTYDIERDVQAFSASTLEALPIAARAGTYVQLGLDGRKVRWLAGYSAVVEFPTKEAVAYHNGVLVDVDDGEATFEDGSVLAVAADVDEPPNGSRVTAEIDASDKKITRFTPAAGVARPAAP